MKLPPLVLAYHGVADVPYAADPHLLFVAPDDLRRHIDVLRRWGYRLVSFRELALTPKSGLAALTFDDGLADGLEALSELARSEDAPTTAFVPSGWLGRPHPDVPLHRIVDPSELRHLVGAGVHVGGHTASHFRLTDLSENQALEELRTGRLELEAAIGRPVDVAAYPYGAATAATRRACRAAGFVAACRTDGAGTRSDPFDVPRQAMHNSCTIFGLRLKRRDRYEAAVRLPMADRSRRACRRARSTARLARWHVELERLPCDWRREWCDFERRGAGSPYLRHDWVGAWLDLFRPARPLFVRIRASHGGTIALGIVESLPDEGWRFAGHPVTSDRRLLCAPGTDAECWRALARRAPDHVDAEGVPSSHLRLTKAGGRPVPTFELSLPGSFAHYLALRPPGVRKGLKQTLRRLAAVGASLDTGPALLNDFLALHHARADAKGERHSHVDERLVALLRRVPTRIFGLRVEGSTVAVSVRLDDRDTAYVYNGGFDPSWGRVSPGVGVELASIEDAVARGLRRFHLGPGDYRHKRDLGAAMVETMAIETLHG